MPVDVEITEPAAAFRDQMDRRHRKRYEDWLRELKTQGCAAMGYRMTGEIVERMCVQHLRDADRAIVVFESPRRAVIVALGTHDTNHLTRDVYTALYQLAGIEPPSGTRTKPPCCDDAGPPGGSRVLDDLADRLREVAKTARRGRRR